ncbi:hypothetical protein L7F22_054137 [Adiantum nelumboides]|nr:hypothetical protein [Adiantum nelumboides]
MLEEQTYGSAHLRPSPPPIHVAQVTHMRERDLPGWGSNVKNLEEWEQLSQEPDSTVEEGSHILGLSNLSIDTFEKGNTAPDEEQKMNTQTEESMTASEGKKVYVEKNTNRPVNEDECESAVREGEQNSMGQFLLVKDHQESLREVIYDGENCEDSLQNMEEQEIQAGGGWERAVSRSTRRKHEKRAARAAMKNLSTTKREVESVEGNQGSAMVSQTDGVNSDAICSCTGIDSEDGEESVVDEIDYFQDGTISEEACPSISETSGEKKAKAGSNQDSESEASWALRPLSQSKVACVTADFPMQNVLLQIGLRVISPNGLQIQQLQRWALKCEACRNVTSDVGRIFCPKCGNGGTLYKVSITIGPNGVVHTGTKKRFNIRGTKYSLPLPKGGRQGVSENPILREDQLPKKMLRSKKKATIPDLTSPAEAFVMKSGVKLFSGSHTQTEESMTASEGKKVYVEKNTNRPVNEDECESAVREGEQNSMGQFLLVKDHQESLREVIYDGENCEDSLQNMEEQEIQAGGGWERAVSRSTRRKHEKRAARAAMKNLSTTKRSCTGIDSEDGEESVVDEIDYFQDGTISEEACPSISETSGEKKAKAGSNQDSESEASWALRPLSQSKVACVTADFPMQNVLLQIGLRVISPNGLQIQQLQRWALKCEACRNVTSDVGRIFCPKCGNGGTLYKVSITIGPNGVVHTGTKKRFNIRGTKYSLPLPKGGRQGVSENPILREDQLPKKMLRSKKKATIPDLTSPAEAFVMKSGGKEKVEPPIREALAIFSGKRNPNRPRSKQRG